MARTALSNRERKALKKAIVKTPRHARGEAAVEAARTPRGDGGAARAAAEDLHDGLDWLRRKGRLTAAQVRVGEHYRQGYRDAGEVSMPSCLEGGVGGGSAGFGVVPLEVMADARRRMFVWRYHVMRGQVDMLSVMDGVCGSGHTVRYLAGGNEKRGRELEAVLRVALDLIVAFEAGPPQILIQPSL